MHVCVYVSVYIYIYIYIHIIYCQVFEINGGRPDRQGPAGSMKALVKLSCRSENPQGLGFRGLGSL